MIAMVVRYMELLGSSVPTYPNEPPPSPPSPRRVHALTDPATGLGLHWMQVIKLPDVDGGLPFLTTRRVCSAMCSRMSMDQDAEKLTTVLSV